MLSSELEIFDALFIALDNKDLLLFFKDLSRILLLLKFIKEFLLLLLSALDSNSSLF